MLAHPEISIFHEGWGRPGDTGFVAEVDGVPVGAVWYRLFTEESTARDTSTSRRPSSRSRSPTAGAARASDARCWRRWHERARADGVERISLSVDADNPAKRLYARLGYAEYEPGDGLGRMILTL